MGTGGKAERSTTGRVDLTGAGAKTELTPGARVELTSVIKHDRDIPGYHETGQIFIFDNANRKRGRDRCKALN